jgi:hypothetical protein
MRPINQLFNTSTILFLLTKIKKSFISCNSNKKEPNKKKTINSKDRKEGKDILRALEINDKGKEKDKKLNKRYSQKFRRNMKWRGKTPADVKRFGTSNAHAFHCCSFGLISLLVVGFDGNF